MHLMGDLTQNVGKTDFPALIFTQKGPLSRTSPHFTLKKSGSDALTLYNITTQYQYSIMVCSLGFDNLKASHVPTSTAPSSRNVFLSSSHYNVN
jgi:hypothetical protein